ncbi:hypothetical protein EJB05_57105, partial [Eragrostis curvula]
MTTTPVLNLSSAPDGKQVPQSSCVQYKCVFEKPPRGTSRHEDSEQKHFYLRQFAKDRFVERQHRTTAQSTGLIMVDLVKYYAVFPVLPAFMEWGRKGYFQTQRSKTVMTAMLTVRSGLDPHMIRVGWMDMVLA